MLHGSYLNLIPTFFLSVSGTGPSRTRSPTRRGCRTRGRNAIEIVSPINVDLCVGRGKGLIFRLSSGSGISFKVMFECGVHLMGTAVRAITHITVQGPKKDGKISSYLLLDKFSFSKR